MELQKMEGFREPTEKEAVSIFQCNSSSYTFSKFCVYLFMLSEFLFGLFFFAGIQVMIRLRKITLGLALLLAVFLLMIMLADDLRERFSKCKLFMEALQHRNFDIAACKVDYVIRDGLNWSKAAIKIDSKRCNNLIRIPAALVKDWMRDNDTGFCVIRCHYWTDEENVHTYICRAKDLQ